MAKLGEICLITMGQSPDSATYNETGNGLPFFQGNADFGKTNPTARIWCSEPKKIANPNDILISVRAPIGALNIADVKCCIGRGLASLTVNDDKSIGKYIWYALESKVNDLISMGTGSTFKAIGKDVLYNLEIPLPPLETQHQIASTLDKVTHTINLCNQIIEKLDLLIKARFVEMFGDVIKNDKHWKVFQFSDITTSRLGKMLDAKQQTGKEAYPYLANYNVQWFYFDLNKLNRMDFNENDRIEFELQNGDLLVCEGGEIGRCAIWYNEIQPCYFQKALHRVRCNTEFIIPDYLAWWFKYQCEHKGFAEIEGAKATIAHLPGVKLKKLNVGVPPLKLQHQFADLVEQTDKSKSAVKQVLKKAEMLKKALMQEYFR